MKILLIAEHDNQNLKISNRHVLTAACELKGEIDLLVIGNQCDAVVEAAKKLPSIHQIRVADAPAYAHQLAENSAELIASLAAEYQYILMAANTTGKDCLPRVAALLDLSMVSDVVAIVSADTFKRYRYAGNVLTTVVNREPIKILTIRQTAFTQIQTDHSTEMAVEKVNKIFENKLTQFVNQELNRSVRPELASAKIIVAGGRGFKSAENFKLLEKLADQLGAAIGASRAAVDAGFAPNDYQVGQTGKVVAPDVYMAIGISGAIQHLAGMKDSKIVIAINSDPDAPIFQAADYGFVGDLFEVLVEIEKLIKDK